MDGILFCLNWKTRKHEKSKEQMSLSRLSEDVTQPRKLLKERKTEREKRPLESNGWSEEESRFLLMLCKG